MSVSALRTFALLAGVLLFSTQGFAGVLRFVGGQKSGGCADGCSPECCQPTIARPCCINVYSYQRKDWCRKPDCAEPSMAEGCLCSPESCSVVASDMDLPTGSFCSAGCSEGCTGQCFDRETCCAIAELIHQSMTGCYAADRRRAIHRLGDHFDCCCHPEIMNAFIYALNDADEHVRAKAADEIGDQIRRNRCICGSPVIRALTTALGDCDPSVRRQAEQALKASGYRIEDGCCVTFSSGIRLSRSTTQNSETSGLTAADPVQKSETLAFVSPSAEQVGFSVDPDDDSDVAVIPPPVPARDPLSGAGLRLIDTFGYQKN